MLENIKYFHSSGIVVDAIFAASMASIALLNISLDFYGLTRNRDLFLYGIIAAAAFMPVAITTLTFFNPVLNIRRETKAALFVCVTCSVLASVAVIW